LQKYLREEVGLRVDFSNVRSFFWQNDRDYHLSCPPDRTGLPLLVQESFIEIGERDRRKVRPKLVIDLRRREYSIDKE
jgi:hypothetical protein